ncbi:MAG TPA: toll/interleukin-1 receptor domain-containing protein [Candidatus Dormibacteraeota bacterium]|jgi:hypothetical protein
MTRIFISYARVDWELAARLREWVAADGHHTFLDTHAADGVQVGEPWEARLHERLLWADALISVVTTAYVASVWCSAEIAVFRWERQGLLLPLNAELHVEHPLLRTVQGADYARDPAAAVAAVLRSLRELDARRSRGGPVQGGRLHRPSRGGHAVRTGGRGFWPRCRGPTSSLD